MSKDWMPADWKPEGGWTPEALAIFGFIDGDRYLELTANYSANREKTRTPETRAAIVASNKARWAKQRLAAISGDVPETICTEDTIPSGASPTGTP